MRQLVKGLASLMMVLAVVVGLQVAQPQKAEAYTYWNGDTNYILLHSQQGVHRWLDVSSIVVKQNGAGCQEWAQIVVIEAENKIIGSDTVWYAWQDNAFISNNGEDWKLLNLTDRTSAVETAVNGFKIGYYKAFGHGFS